MRYLFLLLLLISCNVTNCRVGPNIIINQKEAAKNNTENVKVESKTVMAQLYDLKENLSPGGQLRCNF